jgi:hypothetical protein
MTNTKTQTRKTPFTFKGEVTVVRMDKFNKDDGRNGRYTATTRNVVLRNKNRETFVVTDIKPFAKVGQKLEVTIRVNKQSVYGYANKNWFTAGKIWVK